MDDGSDIVVLVFPGDKCPWHFDKKALVVCYQASAELSYFASAGWEMPTNILDLYAEYRRVINGEFDEHSKRVGGDAHKLADGRTRYGLLAAAFHCGVASRTGSEKQSMIKRKCGNLNQNPSQS
jgi:hypothetical protein